MIALALGWLLDLIIGDPYDIPHPVRWIGHLIGCLDKKLLDETKSKKEKKARGFLLCAIVICIPASVGAAVLIAAYRLHVIAGIAFEAVLGCYMLACKSLHDESMKVYKALESDDVEAARYAVSMIVGRDTDVLDKSGIIKAAVETVAENASDGVIAPLIYLTLGGPVFGLIYKSVNTMDSMVGYRNERYEDFGYAAAKLDDILNFIPARISALLMIVAASVSGKDYNAKKAAKIFKRDRYNHKSPNSAQCESVCAGALGVRLAGDAFYFGKPVKKPYIGDDDRDIEPEDIKRANRLMMITSLIAFLLCEVVMALMAAMMR